jgi:electron transport complex protein RnfC
MIDSFVPPSWGGKSIYLNNFLRKNKCTNFDYLSLNDTVNTIFVLDDVNDVVTKCIKCGKCVDICPMKINPLDKKLDPSCVRCGLCNYICPANINLIVRVKDNG